MEGPDGPETSGLRAVAPDPAPEAGVEAGPPPTGLSASGSPTGEVAGRDAGAGSTSWQPPSDSRDYLKLARLLAVPAFGDGPQLKPMSEIVADALGFKTHLLGERLDDAATGSLADTARGSHLPNPPLQSHSSPGPASQGPGGGSGFGTGFGVGLAACVVAALLFFAAGARGGLLKPLHELVEIGAEFRLIPERPG